MPQRIQIPEDEIQKLMNEVEQMSPEQLEELGKTYAARMSHQYQNRGDAQRMREAIRRKRMKMVVDKARELGLITKPTRGASSTVN